MTFLASASSNRVTARTSVSRSGFSAIELLIVCAIVGIFATLAYPRVNFTQFQVDSGARSRSSQRRALAHQDACRGAIRLA